MWNQIRTLAWAQWRTVRNHVSRTTVGSLLSLSVAIVWYGGWLALAIFVGLSLPGVPLPALRRFLGAGLFGVCIVWQLLPLITLTGGWSIDIKKLQIYPISRDSLLLMEASLRVTGGLEMMLILVASAIGLMFHPDVPITGAAGLLLFLPFNLFAALLTRDLFVHLFRKTKLRELVTVLFLCVSFLPQLVVRLGWWTPLEHGLALIAHSPWTPWSQAAGIATSDEPVLNAAGLISWILLVGILARRQFGSSIREEELLRTTVIRPESRFSFTRILEIPAGWFPDPLGALISKEVRALLRMPRFRVIFLLASLFSVCLMLPFGNPAQRGFGAHNFLSLVNLYGLIVLGDTIIWNMFGFDQSAAQLYFAVPVKIRTVILAKNAAAAIFVVLQSLAAMFLASIFRFRFSASAALTAFCVSVAMGIYYLAVGNMSSVIAARGADPRATMKKQTPGSAQLWVLGCTSGSLALVGLAYLAGWATDNAWASRGVLAVEFIIGFIFYRVSLDSAVARIDAGQEELLDILSKRSSSPLVS